MKIHQFPETLAVVKLPPGGEVPEWAESSSIFSITATATETSLVCAGRSVPTKATHHKPFTAFRVEGPLDLETTGVLVELLTPLAEAGISVLTLSTYETEWVLVRVQDADRAAEEWRRRGHEVTSATPVKPGKKQKKT